jgi:hypothetical protein
VTYECLECGTVFESGHAHPECPNEQSGLESHAVRPVVVAEPAARRVKRRSRFRLFGR